MTTLYDRDTQVQSESPQVYSAKVSENWGINGVPNGGYLMALAIKALRSETERKAPVQVTANYLRRTEPTGIEIHTELMGASRQFDRMQARIIQNEKETIRLMATFMDDYDDGEVFYQRSAPDVLPRKQCTAMLAMPKYTLFSNIKLLMEPEALEWVKGKSGGEATHRGWIRLKDERPWDELSLVMAADAIPPPVLSSQGPSSWVPTIELSVQLRRMPTSRWLKCEFKSNYITGSLLETDCELWDEEGNLIALGRQLSQFKKGTVGTVQKYGMKAAGAYLSIGNMLKKKD